MIRGSTAFLYYSVNHGLVSGGNPTYNFLILFAQIVSGISQQRNTILKLPFFKKLWTETENASGTIHGSNCAQAFTVFPGFYCVACLIERQAVCHHGERRLVSQVQWINSHFIDMGRDVLRSTDLVQWHESLYLICEVVLCTKNSVTHIFQMLFSARNLTKELCLTEMPWLYAAFDLCPRGVLRIVPHSNLACAGREGGGIECGFLLLCKETKSQPLVKDISVGWFWPSSILINGSANIKQNKKMTK